MLQLFSDKDTVDDLGIGTVRDAISNALFPGTSIIQTRARYFLFIPWVFRHAERHHPQQVVAKATDAERNLIGALIKGDDHDGLIGLQAGRNVRTLPSAIFWGGLIRYGIFLAPSLSIRQYGRHVARGLGLPDTEDEIADRSPTFWQRDVPDPPPAFFRFESANFDLSREEAEWLTERILSADPPHDISLLSAYVRDLRRGAPAPQADEMWSATLPTDAPPAMVTLVHHAQRLSCAIHGAALVYNLMLAEERPTSLESNDGTSPDTYRLWLDEWTARATAVHLVAWANQPEAFWDCVLSHAARIPPATRVFIDAWLALLAAAPRDLASSAAARELIRERKTQHKRAQARLANRKRLAEWRGYAGTSPLVFRWPQVQRMLRDIAGGLASAGVEDAVA
jgi:hypothetical protein